MWDSVPWFVGGGAHHSPEIARLLAYAATSAAEGVVTPGDLKVVPLDVPGSSVRVLSGACFALNRAAGGSQQTYISRNPSQDVVSISATGSGSGRSDLVVARIEDPNMPGEPWANPGDPTVGPYVFTRIIPNVAPTTTTMPSGQSGIPLARIDIPANTGTVTTGMIKDLRKLARPRSWADYDVQAGINATGGGAEYIRVTDADWRTWPLNTLAVAVPSWATHAQVSVHLSGIGATGPGDVNTRVQFGSLFGAISYLDYNGNPGTPVGFTEKINHFAYGEFDVRGYQGSTQTLKVNSRRTWPQNTGQLWFGDGEQIAFDIRFREQVV
ncbi:hypothetical protein [Amycolatopsis sp. PS_44_ISF1]|uniref:hypothetical protein n=1 Tax=Amycolatopsis sp. PS_44_ISF1 TaxID=2974917 RepID=UPI0028DFA3CD|nr:hypothetical protein [Amycolatopsis sp. PS_44_ISF1]MDT8915765.1 hypothetical protein [Amycolatopsis sp. PS_44_ISF1]MDT8916291.1 hypothetical protein [Amycolatopsis sp. PS_44_ISF1]MDT8916306.1 hypothetical protein [Amycolatopsis sp. PS_44_ISF1]